MLTQEPLLEETFLIQAHNKKDLEEKLSLIGIARNTLKCYRKPNGDPLNTTNFWTDGQGRNYMSDETMERIQSFNVEEWPKTVREW